MQAWEIRPQNDWTIVAVTGRIDSFNAEPFHGQLGQLMTGKSAKVALDLTRAKFLSLPSIKYISAFAAELKQKGGSFALLGASEKLKRQIETYATLNPMQVVRSVAELDR